MKKILFPLVFIGFFFFSPHVYAACEEAVVTGITCPRAGQVECAHMAEGESGDFRVICCDTVTECSGTTFSFPTIIINDLCDTIADSAKRTECTTCMDGNQKIWTAIGCVNTDLKEFFSTILGFGMGIAGGIAFLLILLGGFQILTSAGNPEQLNAGKELVGSAITGLLLIIFSIFFLKIIGVDILGIPGWNNL